MEGERSYRLAKLMMESRPLTWPYRAAVAPEDLLRLVDSRWVCRGDEAVVALWRSGHTTGQVGAVVSAALGALVFANAYFVNNEVIWQILDPVRMLTPLAWAAGVSQSDVATAESG